MSEADEPDGVQATKDQAPPFQIIPIHQVQVYREVLRQLDGLVSGLRPGDRLGSERELAERLRVSRVSVREALRALEGMGKVEVRRNAGTYVVDPAGRLDIDHIRGGLPADSTYLGWLSQLRSAIEVKVVELVGRRRPDLAPARRVLQEAGEELGRDPGEDRAMDLRFEVVLAQLVENPVLQRTQRMVHRLWVTGWADAGLSPGDRHDFHREHGAILAALESGKVALAARLMRDHVDRPVVRGRGTT
ncbi:MAG: FadR family transcriptional regulator [Candidatus Dormibacteraeota bacterium]|nr:FadR family transcriptional regulator [Candidatus Dormibacteraeota bacterium]MBO0744966.1 FadR family transcriptional regulator [Candidatus Dormibacteraeota bacterium]